MMPQWLRNLVMLVVLAAWLAVVIVTLIRGELPDPILLGVPGGLWLALNPPRIGGGGSPPPDVSTAPADGATT
ncbi:MAG TPA: hypothetical protein VFX60_19310 [Micromonospora sp.]|nr:hypothetical protein [Micromonospora sp.]